jgi:hypothetical protein
MKYLPVCLQWCLLQTKYKHDTYSGTYWLRTYVTSQNFCPSKTQVSDDCNPKPSFHVFVFVLPYIKTDSVITNCSDWGLNILSALKNFLNPWNFRERLYNSSLLLQWFCQPRKKQRFLFADIQRRNNGPLCWCHISEITPSMQVRTQESLSNEFVNIIIQVSLKGTLKYSEMIVGTIWQMSRGVIKW